MNESSKVFWHEAFFEALQLEFHQYHDALTFDNEYQLSKEALIMDVLVVKKKQGQRIDKSIGRFFETHNIFEYKSDIAKTVDAYIFLKDFESKNVYLDRLIKANKHSFNEAINMSFALQKNGYLALMAKYPFKLVDFKYGSF